MSPPPPTRSPFGMVDVPPEGAHRATVIWLHGLGADGNDFMPIVPALRLPGSLGVRFRFPEAPVRPVTLNGGFPMRSWFDIRALPADAPADAARFVDREQLAESVAVIRTLAREEQEAGIPPHRIVLAGFSQGGSVALAAAALDGLPGEPAAVGGVMALSTHVARTEAFVAPRLPGARLFCAHGDSDDVIPIRHGEATYRALRHAGWDGVFRSYPAGHQVSAVETRDIGRFLHALLRNPA